MLRRFLDGLEQGVERTLGEHVDLVDYIDFVSGSGGSEVDFLKDGSDIVYTVVGSSVHLGNIEDGAVKDALTCRTFVAGITVNGMLAVNSAGEDLRNRGLTCTVLAAEKISVSKFLGNY